MSLSFQKSNGFPFEVCGEMLFFGRLEGEERNNLWPDACACSVPMSMSERQ